MPITIDGTTGISGNNGSASTPAIKGEDTNTGVFFPAADTVAVATGGSERLRVDSSGSLTVDTDTLFVDATNNRVGVGTITPATALDVNGDLTIADKIVHSGDTNTAIRFPAADTVTVETSGAERLRVDSSGNVGIGTSSVSYRLHLNNASAVDIETGVTNSAGTSRFGTRGSGNAFAGAFTAGKSLELWSAGSQAATIDASGNLGLGTSSPGAKLQVVGGIRYDSSVTAGFGLNQTAAYSFNNGSGNSIGSVNFGFAIIAISQGNGMTIIPVFANAGGGIAWTMSMFDPDNANFVYGAGPTVSFATAGTAANSYTISVAGGSGVATITRTAGSAAYTVHVLALVS